MAQQKRYRRVAQNVVERDARVSMVPTMEGVIAAQTVSRLMAAFRQGDKQAANELVEMFLPQLRRLAEARMRREPSGHSWQPTLLVNELYLELIKVKALRPPESDGGDEKSAFMRLSGFLMKRLLVHHARPLSAQAVKVEVDEGMTAISSTDGIVEIENALESLASIRPRLRSIVELRVFEGLTGDEIADRLQCAPATVARDWSFAKRWLQRELQPRDR